MDSVITISPTISLRLFSFIRLTLIRLCFTGEWLGAETEGAAAAGFAAGSETLSAAGEFWVLAGASLS